MNKSLILNVLKVALLVLIGLGFFLPFVTGKVFSTALMAFVEFSDSLYNVDDFATRLGNTADSTVLFVVLYFVFAVGAAVVLFVKPAFSRVANLVVAGLGLGLYGYVYFQLFIDKSPELEAALASVHPQLGHTLTMNIGYGLFVGLIAVVLAVVVEFLGEKLVSFLK
jgi:Flp pilus assembly pilin Flp